VARLACKLDGGIEGGQSPSSVIAPCVSLADHFDLAAHRWASNGECEGAEGGGRNGAGGGGGGGGDGAAAQGGMRGEVDSGRDAGEGARGHNSTEPCP